MSDTDKAVDPRAEALAQFKHLLRAESEAVRAKTHAATSYGAATVSRDPEAPERAEAALKANMEAWGAILEAHRKLAEWAERALYGGEVGKAGW